MAEEFGIYKCNICGNVIEVIEAHAGALVCCGKEMELLQPKTQEQEGKEKHVPVIEIEKNKVTVKVGSIPHPMEEKHYIGLIEILKNNKVIASQRLKPSDKPEAKFILDDTEDITAREYCNIHGLWTD